MGKVKLGFIKPAAATASAAATAAATATTAEFQQFYRHFQTSRKTEVHF
jgi:hypothetical protein